MRLLNPQLLITTYRLAHGPVFGIRGISYSSPIHRHSSLFGPYYIPPTVVIPIHSAKHKRWFVPTFLLATRIHSFSYNRYRIEVHETSRIVAERTLIAVKPDGLQRGLGFRILRRFEERGFRLCGLKLARPSEALVREHYRDSQGKTHYEPLVSMMLSGPVIASVWEGPEVLSATRAMIGATYPLQSAPGTIRGDFGLHQRRNLVHGSDSPQAAQREIALWFGEEELVPWEQGNLHWLTEL